MVRMGSHVLVRAREILEEAEEGSEDCPDGGLAEIDERGSGDVENVILGQGMAIGTCAMWQLRWSAALLLILDGWQYVVRAGNPGKLPGWRFLTLVASLSTSEPTRLASASMSTASRTAATDWGRWWVGHWNSVDAAVAVGCGAVGEVGGGQDQATWRREFQPCTPAIESAWSLWTSRQTGLVSPSMVIWTKSFCPVRVVVGGFECDVLAVQQRNLEPPGLDP